MSRRLSAQRPRGDPPRLIDPPEGPDEERDGALNPDDEPPRIGADGAAIGARMEGALPP